MGASNYPGLAIPKPPAPTKKKREQRRGKATRQRTAFDAVDDRDKGRCQLTGRKADTHSPNPLDRIHHHHIVPRSAGGPDLTWNLASVLREVHELLHAVRVTVRGDADEHLVWTLRADAVVEVFGRRQVPDQTERGHQIRVVADDDWNDYIRTEARERRR